MFGHDALPSIVFSYGAQAPISQADLVAEQMRLAHSYRNRIVEMDLARRAKSDALVCSFSPRLPVCEAEIAAAEASLELARREINVDRAKSRKRIHGPASAAAKAYLAALKPLRAERKALRAALFASPEFETQSVDIKETHKQSAKQARAECGLYWGTYLHVEHSMSDVGRGAPPKFMRWDGDGHLAVQIQKWMPVARAFSARDKSVCIVMRPDDPTQRRAVVSMRVGSEGKRIPIFAEIPVVLHRPMPSDANIKWVHLLRRRVGTHDRWQVQFVLSRASGWADPDRSISGSVGIDVGWRMRPDGSLRVAYWLGSDGAEGELSLDAHWVRGMRKVEDIHSIRAKLLNTLRDDFCAQRKVAGEAWPAWLREATETAHAWRSEARFAALAIKWRTARWDGDAGVFTLIEEWRKRDKHLLEYEANLRDKLQARRLDSYRVFAAMIRRRYAKIIVEKLDLRDFHVLPEPEDAKAPESAARKHTRDAALSILRDPLIRAGAVEVPPEYTTKDCASCGSREVVDGAVLVHTCSRCGEVWDQDRNAARNLLRFASGSGQIQPAEEACSK